MSSNFDISLDIFMELRERLREARRKLGLTQEKFGEILELSLVKIRELEGGRNKITRELAIKIEQNCHISKIWLLFGEGTMMKEVGVVPFDNHLPTTKAQSSLSTPSKNSIPLYNARAAAGFGALNESEAIESHMTLDPLFMSQRGLLPGNSAALRAQGDSMEPLLHGGDILLISLLKGEKGGGVYVFKIGTEVFVKRLQSLGNGRFRVQSDNSLYAPFEITTKEGFKLIGKVRAVLKKV